MMTRQDYIKIARGFRLSKPTPTSSTTKEVEEIRKSEWSYTVRMVVNQLRKDNPNFNVRNFMNECACE